MAALAGCTASARGPETMTARDAIDAAWETVRETHADAQLVAVRGTEGEQLVPAHAHPQAAEAADENGEDATPGDGQAASWVAVFAAGESMVTVRIYADGRDAIVHDEPVPQPVADGQKVQKMHGDAAPKSGPQESDAGSWSVDSDTLSATVLALPEFKAHVAEYPAAGWSYTYIPYSPAMPVRDYSFMMFSMQSFESAPEVGWFVGGNVWVVQHLDAAAAKDGKVPTLATAVVDAATGKVTEVLVHVPRFVQQVLDLNTQYDDPLVPSGLAPAVHEEKFEVPAGSNNLGGFMYGFGGTLGAPIGVGVDQARLELVDPSGNVAYTASGLGGDEVGINAPAAGTWTLRVSHDYPVPQSNYVTAMLFAAVPDYG